jgi:predicted lipoprotein with Yx(FWY)xxD motif
MRTFSIALLAAIALVCATGAMSSGAPARSTVTVHGSAYGRILFDGRGFALYTFSKDVRGRSNCRGACANAWPPYVVARTPRASRGVKSGLLGTIRRRDGSRQVTYAGKPLYYYVGDRRPLQVLCQNVNEFGGLWFVIRPNGAVVQ